AALPEALRALADGSLPDRPDAEARAGLLAWLIERGLLELDESAGGRLGALLASFREIEARLPEPRRAPAMTEGTPEDERVFLRGNPKTVGPVLARRMLSALASDPGASVRVVASGRLDIARRIAVPANPRPA